MHTLQNFQYTQLNYNSCIELYGYLKIQCLTTP